MPILPKNEHCCGCAACFNACAFESIEMTQDELGFYVPSVNLSTCTECKACESVCPTLPFLNFAPYNEIKRKSAFPITINSAFRASEPRSDANLADFIRNSKVVDCFEANASRNDGILINLRESAINRDFTAQNDNFSVNSRENSVNLNDNFSVNSCENLGENLAKFI